MEVSSMRRLPQQAEDIGCGKRLHDMVASQSEDCTTNWVLGGRGM